jgi:hypothetical protein
MPGHPTATVLETPEALADDPVGGFVGAFFALPLAAVIQSFLSTYTKRYKLEDSALTELQEPKPAKPPREHRRRRSSPADPPAVIPPEAAPAPTS